MFDAKLIDSDLIRHRLDLTKREGETVEVVSMQTETAQEALPRGQQVVDTTLGSDGLATSHTPFDDLRI